MGQVCQTTDQEGFSEYFYYDEEGRLETRIDRNGNKTTTHYNMDGNLSYQRAEDKKGRNPAVSRYMYYPDGKLRQAEGGGITYDYAYTPNGLLKSKSASGKTLLEYAYDRMNRLLEAVQDGKTEKYTYDLVGNRLRKESGQKTEIYEYNAKNQLTGIQSGENTIQYRYDHRAICWRNWDARGRNAMPMTRQTASRR